MELNNLEITDALNMAHSMKHSGHKEKHNGKTRVRRATKVRA